VSLAGAFLYRLFVGARVSMQDVVHAIRNAYRQKAVMTCAIRVGVFRAELKVIGHPAEHDVTSLVQEFA
jgi:hypothetical protein